jgi:hypothetical protein
MIFSEGLFLEENIITEGNIPPKPPSGGSINDIILYLKFKLSNEKTSFVPRDNVIFYYISFKFMILQYSVRYYNIREVKIPRFRFTGTGYIHVPVPVNRGTICNLRNPRYSAVRKPMREWQLSLLRFAIDC